MDSAALVRPGDWLGWEYSEALPLAEKLGQAPRHVVVSRPPCSGIGEGALRIMTVRPYVSRKSTCNVGQGEGAAMAGPGAVEKTDGAALSGAAQRKQPQGGELNDGDLSAWNSAWMGEWEWVLTYTKFERIVRERRR